MAAGALAACSGPAASRPSSSPASPGATPAASSRSGIASRRVVRAGFVFLGTPSDKGWTNAHNKGRKLLERELAGYVETAFAERVPGSMAAQSAFEDFARKGFDIVYGCSFDFKDAIVAAAQNYPEVKFEHNSGSTTLANLGTYHAAQEDARYIGGILAGRMTRTNILGFMGSFPIPEVIRDLNGFAMGVKAVNPAARIQMTWISTWFDPGKEAAASNRLLDLGADVLSGVTDSPAMAQAAAARKRYSLGSNSDQSAYAPEFMLASAYYNWGRHYVSSVKAVRDGVWKPIQVYYHMKDGVSLITPPARFVPADIARVANDAVARLKAGETFWRGPIRDNRGNLVVAEGQSLGDVYHGAPLPGQTREDAYVQSPLMNWALDNVIGELPAA